MASRVVAIFASSAGFRKLVASTIVPSTTRSVAAATAESSVHASWIPEAGPSSRKMRWS